MSLAGFFLWPKTHHEKHEHKPCHDMLWAYGLWKYIQKGRSVYRIHRNLSAWHSWSFFQGLGEQLRIIRVDGLPHKLHSIHAMMTHRTANPGKFLCFKLSQTTRMLPSISATDKDDKDLFTQITVSDWKFEFWLVKSRFLVVKQILSQARQQVRWTLGAHTFAAAEAPGWRVAGGWWFEGHRGVLIFFTSPG